MILPKIDKKVLKLMKEVQNSEFCYVAIDFRNMKMHRSISDTSSSVQNAFSNTIGETIKYSVASLHASLNYLQDNQFIVKPNSGPVYQVTHIGWYQGFIRRSEVLHMLLTHVAFPSLVAFITTLLTLFIQR